MPARLLESAAQLIRPLLIVDTVPYPLHTKSAITDELGDVAVKVGVPRPGDDAPLITARRHQAPSLASTNDNGTVGVGHQPAGRSPRSGRASSCMAEFIADSDGGSVATAPVFDDPDRPPPPDPELAPKGWTWNRSARQWKARARAAHGNAAAGPPPLRERAQQRVNGHADAGPRQDAKRDGFPWFRKNDTPPDADPQDYDGFDGSTADPDPAWQRPDGGSPAPPPWNPESVGQDVKDDIAGMLALFYSVPADFLITVDPYCFGALNENLDATIDATVPIICRSKMAVEFVTSASGLMLWIKLLATLKPFFVAVWQHHVIHSVQITKETNADTGRKTGRFAVMQQDFSQYTAA